MESSIYITLDTLKYLKKGGRITPAAAAIGTVLRLNPVLQIQGEKLDAYAKARGKASAKKIMLKAMADDMEKRFADSFKKEEYIWRLHMQATVKRQKNGQRLLRKNTRSLIFIWIRCL